MCWLGVDVFVVIVGVCFGDIIFSDCCKFVLDLFDILIMMFELFYFMFMSCVGEILCDVYIVIIDEVYVVVVIKCGVYFVVSLEWFDVLCFVYVF